MNSDSRLVDRVLAYLAAHRVMTLATAGEDGPWAAAVFYAHDGFDLLFLSAGHTRHGRHLGASPRAAVTVQEDYASWTAIQGIQAEGQVVQLAGPDRAAAVAIYRRKFTFLHTAPAPLAAALARVNWYRFRPQRLYFVDNSQGFGHRDEVPLP